ncbi:hypothetical protein H6G36_15125 [Anabaena minutissima FACHB-250]|nr:hypothetical protein [Anabaena minutissima FACHB-250]
MTGDTEPFARLVWFTLFDVLIFKLAPRLVMINAWFTKVDIPYIFAITTQNFDPQISLIVRTPVS